MSEKFAELVDTALVNHVPYEPGETAIRGRPQAELALADAKHEQLTALTLRARMAQACAQGIDHKAGASHQRVTPQTVSQWRA